MCFYNFVLYNSKLCFEENEDHIETLIKNTMAMVKLMDFYRKKKLGMALILDLRVEVKDIKEYVLQKLLNWLENKVDLETTLEVKY